MKYKFSLFTNPTHAIIFLAIFHFVGLIGIFVPQTYLLFTRLTPLAILLNMFFLYKFHAVKFGFRQLIIFAIIGISGFLIEVAGTNTGLIFGEYKYLDALGIGILSTPFFIGLNWIFIIYLSMSIFWKVENKIIKILLAASIAVIYDLSIEPVAHFMQMWEWKLGSIPPRNFMAWFIISIVFSGLTQSANLNLENKIAKAVFFIQILFFGFINIGYLILTK